MEQKQKNEDVGTIVGIITVIIVLLVGGFYFANQRMEKQKEFQANIKQLEVATSSSDELSDIESSANSMNFDDLGSGIDNL